MPTHTSIDFFAIHRLVITRLDGIAYGIFGAIIKHYYPFLWNRNKKKLFFIGLLIFITYTVFTTYQYYKKEAIFGFYLWNFGYVFCSLAIIIMIPLIETIIIKNKYVYIFITNTSKVSYSMYLIHNTILHSIMFLFFAAFKSLNVLLYVAIYIPALYALSNLNYRYFEKRFIDYREKFIGKFIQ